MSVRSLIADTLELCQARFAAHEIPVVVSDIPATLELEGRPTQLSQVLLNLLNNAHDAVERLSSKWVHLDVKDEGETLELFVTDSGPGLPPEIRDKILTPFFTTKESSRGVGLGLSISASIVQSHTGELLLDPDCANTRFVVRLPKQQPRPNTEPAPRQEEAHT